MRLLALLIVLFPSLAFAHDAPSGWSYPIECCSTVDCREVPASAVKEVWNGYLITLSTKQEIVPYGSYKIKDSPDGAYHWCSQGGTNDGKTLCLFVPPRAF